MRLRSYGGDHFSQDKTKQFKVEVGELTEDEHRHFLAMLAGAVWVRGEEGHLVTSDAFKPTPSPKDDPIVGPYWTPTPGRLVQHKLLELEKYESGCSPSIEIQSVCGYYYTKEKYAEETAKLESYGFECLRSRRGADGKHWEVWYLPGLWSAEGELKEALDVVKGTLDDARVEYRKQDKAKLKAAVKFLCKNVLFGTLNVTVQRACMPIPD